MHGKRFYVIIKETRKIVGGCQLKNKKWWLLIGVAILILGLLIGGKVYMDKQRVQEEKVEQSFDKVLAMYPTKNLMDFYDMEGFRDSEFEKDDKGVWVLDSGMSISKGTDDPLVSEGMNLRMNRNTGKAKGFYYISSIPSDTTKPTDEKKYPVTYDEQGFHLVEGGSDPILKEKIENFQFFVQYASFKEISKNKSIRTMYNKEVPMYELEYQLTNEDQNVKELCGLYNIPTNEAPTLVLSGRGDLEGATVGYKQITIQFTKQPPVYFSDLIDYQPTTEEDNQ